MGALFGCSFAAAPPAFSRWELSANDKPAAYALSCVDMKLDRNIEDSLLRNYTSRTQPHEAMSCFAVTGIDVGRARKFATIFRESRQRRAGSALLEAATAASVRRIKSITLADRKKTPAKAIFRAIHKQPLASRRDRCQSGWSRV
jgi:hypothetical protein